MSQAAYDFLFDTLDSALAYINHVGANHTMRGQPHPQQWLVENLESAKKVLMNHHAQFAASSSNSKESK